MVPTGDLQDFLRRYAINPELVDRAVALALPTDGVAGASFDVEDVHVSPAMRATALRALYEAVGERAETIVVLARTDGRVAACQDPRKRLSSLVADRYRAPVRTMSEKVRNGLWQHVGRVADVGDDPASADLQAKSTRRAVLYYFFAMAMLGKIDAVRRLAPLVQVMRHVVPVAPTQRVGTVWMAQPA